MRILYIALSCGPNLGSEDAVGWNIPCQMKKLGHEVAVLTRSDKQLEIEAYIRENPGVSYPEFIYQPLSKIANLCKGPFYSLRAKLWCHSVSLDLDKLVNLDEYDVIHQITPVEFRAMVNLSSFEGLTVGGPFGGGGFIHPCLAKAYLPAKARLIERMRNLLNEITLKSRKARRAVASFDKLMAANLETKELLEKMGYENCIEVLPEVASIQLTNKNGKQIEEVFTLGVAGRLHYGKGYLFLLDLLETLPRTNWRCLIAGEGDQRGLLEQKIAEKGLSEKIHLLGRLNYKEMNEFYESLDLFLFPSFREATGTVLVEALSNNVPVLSFRTFGARELLKKAPEYSVEITGLNLNEIQTAFANRISSFMAGSLQMTPPVSLAKTWGEYAIWLESIYLKSRRKSN